jgi:hypothetical protein
LQEIGNKKFALELDSFLNETPRGDWLPICPFEKGTRWAGIFEQGTMLSVAPVSTKYLSFVNSSVKKMRPASAGKCIAVQWHVFEYPPNRKWSGGQLVFRISTGLNAPVGPMGVVVVKFANTIARVLEGIEIWAGGGGNFWSGCCRPVCRLSSRC